MDDNKNIISDIWLYNQSSTPLVTEWNESEMPFLNPAEFVANMAQPEPVRNASDISLDWNTRQNIFISVNIFIRSQLIAVLYPHAKPGWSTLVEKDGPLAKRIAYPM
ncbi:MAG: hypothetical protein V4649_08165 [Bacteroidota bacterium]